jgi:uncharacterized repeat protein (TIGR03803 family)
MKKQNLLFRSAAKLILAALFMRAVAAMAQPQSMIIYTDSLLNGWGNWGWATLNYANTSPVRSGSDSVSVLITSAYQGMQVVHNDMSSTPYAYLSFWLNGGPTGGQHLSVYGLLDQNGVQNTGQNIYYPLTPPLANTWSHYSVPLSAIGVANQTNFTGFVIQDGAGTAEPVFYVDDIQLNPSPTSFIALRTFTNNPDGQRPADTLLLAGNTLYGTTHYGGTNGAGMIFSVNTNGTGFVNLYSCPNDLSSGYSPLGGVVLSSNVLYGVTPYGAAYPRDGGTIYALNVNGSRFTNIYTFSDYNEPGTNYDGGQPNTTMVLSGYTLYGTTKLGGPTGSGTVFAINTDGSGFTNLHFFSAKISAYASNYDGATPQGGLILASKTLYGTATYGGTVGQGTIFAVNTDGSNFRTVYNFTNYGGGVYPLGGVAIAGGTLYGATSQGGTYNNGVIYSISTNGTGFTNLYTFSAMSSGKNSDGANPEDSLTVSGNTLYGTAYDGGTAGNGTVFSINTNGTGFTTLYSFSAGVINNLAEQTNYDGIYPEGGLAMAGNTLYGTTSVGGSQYQGTIFSLVPAQPPVLNLNRSGTNIIVTWSAIGYDLLYSSDITSQVWNNASGQYFYTNKITKNSRFFKLSQ